MDSLQRLGGRCGLLGCPCEIGERYVAGRPQLTPWHSAIPGVSPFHAATRTAPVGLGGQRVNADGRKLLAISFDQGLAGLRRGYE
jgi:hypothetical protein